MGLQTNNILSQEQIQGEPPATPPTAVSTDRDKYTYPAEIWRQLEATDMRLLSLLRYDCLQQAKRSVSGAKYSIRPQAYFAAALKTCRATINRSLARLDRLGIITKTRRNPVKGVWQTCMYKLKSWWAWRLASALNPWRERRSRVTPKLQLLISQREKSMSEEGKGGPSAIKGTLTELIERIRRGEKLE